MTEGPSTPAELTSAIAGATRTAVTALFREHAENFYYLSLITTGEGHPPSLAAWSSEALERVAAAQSHPRQAIEQLRWSYADSPYCCFGYEDYFGPVRDIFARRPRMDYAGSDDEWEEELAVRLQAMEDALALLDDEGIFGRGSAREALVINVEVMPPDASNTERARRLNPPAALERWLREAAE
jgi:hypothetical protein